MKTKSHDYATAEATPDAATVETGPAFVIERVRLTRDYKRYPIDPNRIGAKYSIGSAIDEAIIQTLEGGDELQDIAVHFERADWTALREFYFASKPREY